MTVHPEIIATLRRECCNASTIRCNLDRESKVSFLESECRLLEWSSLASLLLLATERLRADGYQLSFCGFIDLTVVLEMVIR